MRIVITGALGRDSIGRAQSTEFRIALITPMGSRHRTFFCNSA